MFLVALLCANAVLGVKFTSQKTDFVNNWDAVMNYHAGRGKIITGIADSVHDNGREDRRFKFYYTDGAEHGISCEPGSWTSYRNGWDGVLDYRCPSHHALNAVYSFHDNNREDRLFRFKCCDIRSHGKFYIHSVHKTNLVSDYDGTLNARCNPNSVLVGLYSYHDNNREDRRWHMYCGIMQEREAPIVTVSSPSKTGYINNWDASFAWTAPVDRLIKNRHGKCIDAPSRGSQRRVITYSCSESNINQQWEYNRSTGQIKLAGVNWCLDAVDTGRTAGGAVRLESCNTNNRNQHWEYDAGTGLVRQQHGGLCLDAPSRNSNGQKLHMIACNRSNYNQLWDVAAGGYKAIVGLESVHDNNKEDRRWKTYYASTPGVRCNPSGWTDYQNLWDGTLDYRCPHNQTGTVDVNVVSISNTFDPEPYQWREAQASYIQQDVIVPLRMKAQCKRKDGRIKELWIDSTLTAAAYSQVEVDFVDRTHQCPQSYYKSCQCVNQLKSNFITSDGCQTHPFFEGHPGCYVFKGNNCGNGQGLGTAEPVSFVEVCTDADRCPNAKLYIDYPLDEYVWEWSYQPCGGDRYYPGDPGYTGPHVDDFVTKMSSKHCREGSYGTLGSYNYDSKVQAILACDALNEANAGTCSGVYDPSCDNRGKFYLCDNTAYKPSSNSCIYRMQEQNGRRRAETGLPKAPESLPEVARTDAELIEEFGDDLVDEEEEYDEVTDDDVDEDGMADEDDEDAEEDMSEDEDAASSDEMEAPAPAPADE